MSEMTAEGTFDVGIDSTDPPAGNHAIEAGVPVRARIACVVMAAIAAALTCFLTLQVPECLLKNDMYDAYFGSDLPRCYREMVSRSSLGHAESRHPLYSLTMISFTLPFRHLTGLSRLTISRIVLSANAFAWASFLFILCWTLTKRVIDSCLLVLLALSSAAAIFWLSVPETFALGSTTILLPLVILCLGTRSRNYWVHVTSQVLSLSMTLTNWMAGLVASALSIGTKRTAVAALHALALVLLLTFVQSIILARPHPFMQFVESEPGPSFANKKPLLRTARHFFLTSLSPAQVDYRIIPQGETWPKSDLPNVDVLPHSGAVIKSIAPPMLGGRWHAVVPWLVWCALLLCGLSAGIRRHRQSVLVRAILLVVLAQFLLHVFYGWETFIYCLHWFPLLTLIGGLTLTTRMRAVGIVCMVLLILHNFIANVAMYSETMRVFRTI